MRDGKASDRDYRDRPRPPQARHAWTTPSPRPLTLCLVTCDGHVHFYSAMRVLLGDRNAPSAASAADEALTDGFASLFLGAELCRGLREGVAPLSRPRASMRLSLPLARCGNRVGDLDGGSPPGSASGKDGERRGSDDGDCDVDLSADPMVWSSFLSHGAGNISKASPSKGNPSKEEHNDTKASSPQGKASWASLIGSFDASIEATSLSLRTLPNSNVLTGACITSDDDHGYLALCGAGRRRVGGGHVELGGFVTFVSLRHCATEARTVYLDFAPKSVRPVFWMHMHLVVLLGEAGRSCRKPRAVAVRVDCHRRDHVPPLGFPFENFKGPPSFPSSSNHLNSDFMPMAPGVYVAAAIENTTRDTTYFPARFETIVINLPSAEESLGSFFCSLRDNEDHHCNEDLSIHSSAIAISSIPSSPPGILLSFQYLSSLIVVNHTLLPSESSTGKSLSTSVRPGHRLLFDVAEMSAESATSTNSIGGYPRTRLTPLKDVWCTGGQVRKALRSCMIVMCIEKLNLYWLFDSHPLSGVVTCGNSWNRSNILHMLGRCYRRPQRPFCPSVATRKQQFSIFLLTF